MVALIYLKIFIAYQTLFSKMVDYEKAKEFFVDSIYEDALSQFYKSVFIFFFERILAFLFE